MSLRSVADIADEFNGHARTLAPELLPNGFRSGNNWMASGIDDTGKSASLAVNLSGTAVGHWSDYGNARAGEDKGDMIDLLALKRYGGDRKAALQDAKQRLGIVDNWTGSSSAPKVSPEELARRAEETRARAQARQAEDMRKRSAKIRGARALYLHKATAPIEATSAERYLVARGMSALPIGAWPGALRFHPEAWNSEFSVKMTAMLGMVLAWQAGEDGAPGKQVHVATHRTYLQNCPRRGWVKIDSPLKRARAVLGPSWGGYIPINKGSSGKSMTAMHPDEPVYMAEGIEKCIGIRMKIPAARIIAGISLKNMGAIVLPPQCRRLVMVVDNDKGDDELVSLERAIAQQQARGLQVQLVRPPAPYKDIDEWMIAVAPDPVALEQGRAA